MKALVTGAASGIGKEMTVYLDELGYDLILVDINKEGLKEIKLKKEAKIIVIDLSSIDKIKELYVGTSNDQVDLLINNAGFGICGDFFEIELERELKMIDLNIKAVHVLTKLFLKDMVERDKGIILNVASLAAYLPGPKMATYYSTKAYIKRLSESINYELKRQGSKVFVSVLCPGPIKTAFLDKANLRFNTKEKDARIVARYALDKLLKNKKRVIVPGIKEKMYTFLSRVLPVQILAKKIYKIQDKKN